MSDATAPTPIVSPRRPFLRVTAGGAVIGFLVVVIMAIVAGGYLLYISEERLLADARILNASVSEQLSKSQQETRDRQAELDTTRQQLARSQAETADSQAAGKALADQLAQSKQQTQDAQALVKSLQGEKDDLTARLASAQKATQDSQAANTALQQKTRRALAKAQLVEEFMSLSSEGKSDAEAAADFFAWFRKLGALNDPTVTGYANDYYAAIKKNPKDTKAFGVMLEKIVVYLSGSIVDDLQ